jgi:hypothetical protein
MQKPQKDRSFWGFLGLAVKVGFEPTMAPTKGQALESTGFPTADSAHIVPASCTCPNVSGEKI